MGRLLRSPMMLYSHSEKAARISNAAGRDGKAKVAERGGESPSYDDWTVSELKKKSELITALRNH